MNKEKIIKAGKIASECKKYARSIVAKGMPLLELAEKIEAHIIKLGGKPAFPVNLSMDSLAAHYTPGPSDTTLASGLLKIDIGVHIDGWIADTAFSVDLEDSEKNKAIIDASEEALELAITAIKNKVENNSEISLSQIGLVVEKVIESFGLSPIINLSGHSIEQYNLHSGTNVPNIPNGSDEKLKEGLYAVEPFATSGSGRVHDGNPSGIYVITGEGNVRSPIARKILEFADEEYQGLPFCTRWIVKKFGPTAVLGLRELEKSGMMHSFAQLLDTKESRVAQTEHTILVEKDKVTVTTL